MLYVITGCLGFLLLYLFDFISLKKQGVKPLVWILCSGLVTYSLVMICLAPDRMLLPGWSAWLGWSLLAISLLLLVYSLFINLPFRKTYIAADAGDKLITTGLYALVRHPGVHWFILLILSLILVSRSNLMLITAPVFILLDIVLVIIQDKFFFGRMFAGYDKYREETPMLVPNRRSVNAFLHSLRRGRA